MSYNAASEGGAGSEKGGELLEGYAEYLRGTAPDTHKQSSPRPRNIIMRACPECGVEMRSDSITKHFKIRQRSPTATAPTAPGAPRRRYSSLT